MKTVMTVFCLLSAVSAFAETPCPQLKGLYDCRAAKTDGQAVKDFDGPTEIDQIVLPAKVTQYQLPLVPNGELAFYRRIADGKEKKSVEKNSHIGDIDVVRKTTCTSNSELLDVATGTPQAYPGFRFSATTHYLLLRNLVINQTFEQSGQVRETSSICIRR